MPGGVLLNLLSHGPIEKGKDVSHGGAEYYNMAIDGAGLAVVADSFGALRQTDYPRCRRFEERTGRPAVLSNNVRALLNAYMFLSRTADSGWEIVSMGY